MVSLLIVLDVSSLPQLERIAAGAAAAAVAEEVGMAKEDEVEEGRVSRTENVPRGFSLRTSLEVQKVRALRTRDSDMWSWWTSWSSVFVRGAVESSLFGWGWKA